MRLFLIIAGAVCGLFLAQVPARAGTCVKSSPINPCGPCKFESQCGGTDHTTYCLAEKPSGCGSDAVDGRVQGGNETSRVKPSTVQRLLQWEGRIEISQQRSLRLQSGEEVVLLIADSDQFSHSEYRQLILFFPVQNRMTSVMSSVMAFEIMDLDSDGNPEIVVHHAFSNGGYTTEGTLLAQISGSELRTLHNFEESTDNMGACSDDPDLDMEPCVITETSVKFRDLNGDKRIDIVETVRTKTKGRYDSTKVTRFQYWNGKVTPL
ncbi:MAG TPA: hypothetical protein PLY68_00715 [Myxococcota bacterium]|nr:hypothetical protein [Myxococcota bacterium]HQP94700.1 hypothetical protein [Myxococcota bacterium]